MASPTLYAGQTARARIEAEEANRAPVGVSLFIRFYGGDDALVQVAWPRHVLEPGAEQEFVWRVDDTGGQPIAATGIALDADDGAPERSISTA